MSIIPLPDAVRLQIKSSTQIASLADVVEGLLINAIDAHAKAVDIEVDFAKGFCSVQDDGDGIFPLEFAQDSNLARTNCTSKLNRAGMPGRNGCFLAHLSSLSLMSISSKHQSSHHGNSVLLRQSKIISRMLQDSMPDLQSHGTRVVVHNLFGNLPVRFKHLASRYTNPVAEESAFEELKCRVVGYLLATQGSLNIRMKTKEAKFKYTHRSSNHATKPIASFGVHSIEHIFLQAGYSNTGYSWKLASAKAAALSVRAAICLEPCPSKNYQFISLGNVPVSNVKAASILYEEVNSVFAASDFGAVEERSAAFCLSTRLVPEYKQASLKGKLVKGVDRFPRFYIRIESKSSADLGLDHCTILDLNEALPALQTLLHLLRSMLIQFLKTQSFNSMSDCNSHTKPATRLQLQDQAHPSSSTFANWKKSKATSIARHDPTEGLPLSVTDTNNISDIVLGDDIRLLLGDIDLDPEADNTCKSFPSRHFENGPTGYYPKNLARTDQIVTWIDPVTGQHIEINPSNGFVLPFVERRTETVHPNTARDKGQLSQVPNNCRLGDYKSRAAGSRSRCEWPAITFKSKQEPEIPSVAHDKAPNAPSKHTHSGVIEQRLTTDHLEAATVLGQVDNKFILAVLPTPVSQTLALIDQHAADERIKVEDIYRQLCSPEPVVLSRPIKFEVSLEEIARFDRHQKTFAQWGIGYATGSDGSPHLPVITITYLPGLIAERCRMEPKNLIQLLRKEIWSGHERPNLVDHDTRSWISQMASCPEGLIELANSRACRTAIMFNDVLTKDECEGLLKRLSSCLLPFQCAHGRPSMSVLAPVKNINLGYVIDETSDFGQAWTDWISKFE